MNRRTFSLMRLDTAAAALVSWAVIEQNAVSKFIPTTLQRFGRPEEIAAAVVFLSNPLASYIHGANLRVDGGYAAAVN